MDRASAVSPLYLRRRHYPGDSRPDQSRAGWIHHGRTLLANEFWYHRKRENDRDRGDLCITLRLGLLPLVGVVATKALTLADVCRAVGFSWSRVTRQRADT